MFSRTIIRCWPLLLVLGLAIASALLSLHREAKAQERQERMPGQDTHGDPLPKDAVARLGTIRFRQVTRTASIAYSPDGKYISTGTENPCEVRLWDAANGKQVTLVYTPGSPRRKGGSGQIYQRVRFSPDGRYLTYIGIGGISFWEVASQRVVMTAPVSSPIAISADSKWMAGVIDRELVIYNLRNRAVEHRLRRPETSLPVLAFAFSPDGKFLATSEGKDVSLGQHPSTLRLWAVETGKQVADWIGHHRIIESLCFSLDSKVLVSCGFGGVYLWDVARQRRIATLEDGGTHVAFSPNGKLLAVGGGSRGVHLWDPASHKRVRVIHPKGVGVGAFAFSPDGKKIVTGGIRHALQLWDVETGRQLPPLSGHEDSVFSLQFAPDGKTLVSYGEDLTIRLWDLTTCKEYRRFLPGTEEGLFLTPGREIPTSSLALSANGQTLAAIGAADEDEANNRVLLWNIRSAEKIATITTPRPKSASYHPIALSISPDGQMVATVHGGNVQLWSAKSATQLRALNGNKRYHPYQAVAFSPDGRAFAARQMIPKQIELWESSSRRLIRSFPSGPNQGTPSLAFSASGLMLAAPCDRAVEIHEVDSGTLLQTLQGHESSVSCVAFSPNGRILASSGQLGKTVQIWDVFTGKELAKFTGHRGPVYCVAFSPDGKTMASGSADTTILLWDISKIEPELPPAIPRNELGDKLPRLSADMNVKDGAKAYQAIWKFLGAGEDAVAFFGQKLHPVTAPDAKRIQQAIADLDSADFDKREAAATHLTKLGELAEPTLRQALQGKPALETRKRIEQMLDDLAERSTKDLDLSAVRAVHALELIGSPAARDLLKKLAAGAEGARLTRDATLALRRLERRNPKP